MERPRQTPYELVFEAGGFEERHFPRILEESESRGVRPDDPDRFLMLATVGELLRELPPELEPEQESGPWGERGSPIRQYGALLFQGLNTWRFDKQLYLLEEPLARWLVTAPPVGEWELTPPHPAGYVQLPRHLFWASIAEDASPEPVDGFFWTLVGQEDPKIPPYDRLDVLLALGLRPGRPGFGVIAIDERLDRLPGGHWADIDARPQSADFANVLPGGELRELYAFTTPGEVLKLLSRCFHYVARHADALEAIEEPAPAADESGAEPHRLPPSSLPYRRLGLVERDG